jgi:hypothetical protein
MFGGDIQRNEIVPFVLDLGAVCDGKTHSREYLKEFVCGLIYDVPFADSGSRSGQGNVNQVHAFGLPGLCDFFFKLLECSVYFVFDSISKLSCGASVFFCNFAYLR